MPVKQRPLTMQDIEDWFRYKAFRIAYEQTYDDIRNNDEHFAKALLSSIATIKDRSLMVEFYKQEHPDQIIAVHYAVSSASRN